MWSNLKRVSYAGGLGFICLTLLLLSGHLDENSGHEGTVALKEAGFHDIAANGGPYPSYKETLQGTEFQSPSVGNDSKLSTAGKSHRRKRKHATGTQRIKRTPLQAHWPPVREDIDPRNLGLNFSLGDEAALGLADLPPSNTTLIDRYLKVIKDQGPPHFLYLYKYPSPNPYSLRWKYRDHYECMLSGMSQEHLQLMATLYNMTLFTPGWVCEMRRREADWRDQFNRSCSGLREDQERKGIAPYCDEATRYRKLLQEDPGLSGRPLGANFSPVMAKCLKEAKGCVAWLIPLLRAYGGGFLFCCALHESTIGTFQWLLDGISHQWPRDRELLLRTEPTKEELTAAILNRTVPPLVEAEGLPESQVWLEPPDWRRVIGRTTLDTMVQVRYGSLLAVFRHGGVIPAWDIDIDLQMDSNFILTVLRVLEGGAGSADAPKNLHYHLMASQYAVSIKIFSGIGALVDLYFTCPPDPGHRNPSIRPCGVLGRELGCRPDWWTHLENSYRNWHSFYGVNSIDHFGRAKDFQQVRVYRDFRNLYPNCTCRTAGS